MKKSIGIIFSVMLAAGLLAGCNGGGSNGGNNGFGTNCGGPPTGFQVLYPRPSAPHVPPNNSGSIYVAANPALTVGNSYNFLATVSGGGSIGTGNFATYNGSIPNPHVSPAPGSTIYVASFLYPIGPLQTVQLFWNVGGSNCTPNVIVSTFTTGP